MKKTIPVFVVCLLVLTACVDRETADVRLAKGCAAGAESLMSGDFKIKEIRDRKFRESPEFGTDYREVTLSVTESDGWSNNDKDIVCVFSEKFGFLGTGYVATIYQLRKDSQVYGQEGDRVIGTMEDHLKLNQAVEAGMQ
jgi:hypothetical protein